MISVASPPYQLYLQVSQCVLVHVPTTFVVIDLSMYMVLMMCYIHTETPSLLPPAPGKVVDLSCPSLASTDTLSITWSPSTDGGDTIVGYQVEVKMYVAGMGREVTTVDLIEPFNKEMKSTNTLVPGLGEL